MGFYREPVSAARRIRTLPTKMRVENGGGLGSITTLIQQRLPGFKVPAPPTTTIKIAPTAPTPTPITSGASIQTGSRTFSPVAPPPSPLTPTPVAPSPTSSFSPVTSTPTPTPTQSNTSLPGGTETSPAGVTGTGSTSGSGSPSDSSGPLQIRFDSSPSSSPLSLPDASSSSGPEVYNADGTPVTPAATAATNSIATKLKNLPTAAKIGGVVALYLLLGRR